MLLIQSFENKSNFIIHTKKLLKYYFEEILVSFSSSIGYILFICSLRFCKLEIVSIII